MTELLIIGAGYTGKTLARQAIAHPEITRVIGTSRSDSTLDALDAMGAHHARFDLVDPVHLRPHEKMAGGRRGGDRGQDRND